MVNHAGWTVPKVANLLVPWLARNCIIDYGVYPARTALWANVWVTGRKVGFARCRRSWMPPGADAILHFWRTNPSYNPPSYNPPLWITPTKARTIMPAGQLVPVALGPNVICIVWMDAWPRPQQRTSTYLYFYIPMERNIDWRFVDFWMITVLKNP